MAVRARPADALTRVPLAGRCPTDAALARLALCLALPQGLTRPDDATGVEGA